MAGGISVDSLASVVSLAVIASQGTQEQDYLLPILSALGGALSTAVVFLWKVSQWKTNLENTISHLTSDLQDTKSNHSTKIEEVETALSDSFDRLTNTLQKMVDSFDSIKKEIQEQRIENLKDFVKHDELNSATQRIDREHSEIWEEISKLRDQKQEKNMCNYIHNGNK